MWKIFVYGCIFILFLTSSTAQYSNCAEIGQSIIDRGGISRTCIEIDSCSTLNSANSYYLLNTSLSSSGTCLTYGAENIVLDLNGHTITFDTAISGGVYGVRANGYNNLILTSSGEGKIVQDQNCPLETTECSGDRAVSFGGNEGSTIENIYIDVRGYDTHGIFISGGSLTSTFFNVINNTINHSGTYLSSRAGFTSMPMKIDKVYFPMNVSYNVILDSPHGGIAVDNNGQPEGAMDGSVFSYNYMDIDDAYYANPTGILFYRVHAVDIHHNTFVGDGMEGVQFDGFTMAGTNRAKIHDNFFNLSTIRWPRGQSLGPGSMQGIRIRYGAKNLDIYNNHIIGRAKVNPYDEQSSAFALWMDCRQSTNDCTDVKIWNNTFEAYTDGTPSGNYGAGGIGHAVGTAFTGIGSTSDIEFYNNTLKSNNEVLVFYDGVINDMNGSQFHDNSLEILGTTYSPQTIYGGWIETPPMHIILRDTTFLGSASKTDFGFERSTDTLTYEWGLDIIVNEDDNPANSSATGTIVDNEATTEFSGTINNGVLSTQYLKEWISTRSGITNTYTPYNISITLGLETQTQLIIMNESRQISFDFYSSNCTLPYDVETCDCIDSSELAQSVSGWYNRHITMAQLILILKTWKICSDE